MTKGNSASRAHEGHARQGEATTGLASCEAAQLLKAVNWSCR